MCVRRHAKPLARGAGGISCKIQRLGLGLHMMLLHVTGIESFRLAYKSADLYSFVTVSMMLLRVNHCNKQAEAGSRCRITKEMASNRNVK